MKLFNRSLNENIITLYLKYLIPSLYDNKTYKPFNFLMV